MEIDELISYQEVVDSLNKKGRKKHLILGNGFSMAYDKEIFSYNALSGFIEKTGDPLIRNLFSKLKTKNFELIMQQLDSFSEIAEIFSDDKSIVKKIVSAREKLKNSLIEAIKELHPEHVFTIPESKSQACLKYLAEYLDKEGLVFSTNYDLLLYWVTMRNGVQNSIDGFGRDLETELEEGEYVDPKDFEYSELRWGKHKNEQSVFYLHGTLPFFDTGIHIVKEEYHAGHLLLENVKERIDRAEYPIFVTAGNGTEKLTHIMHNKYLSFCYDQLSNIKGSLVTFGFNFGESDLHIIDAINTAAKKGKKTAEKLWSIYIGVYSDENLKHIKDISHRFKCKVVLYNARTVDVWGD